MEQLALFEIAKPNNSTEKLKRSWENAFQKWSDEYGMGEAHSTSSYGCCGYGSMCDWCDDNTCGRPCVRALNKMCREKRITIDYTDKDFSKVWFMAERSRR